MRYGGPRRSVADRTLILGAAIGAGVLAMTRRRRSREARPGDLDAGNAHASLTADQHQQVKFALEVIDRLAASCDFDPQELISPQTGRPLGPVLERLRTAVDSNSRRL